jgi:hypothetical protein
MATAVVDVCPVRETEMLMEDEQRWKAMPQEEQAEQEQALSQNGAIRAVTLALPPALVFCPKPFPI